MRAALDKHSVRSQGRGSSSDGEGTLLHWQSGDDGPVLSEAEVIGRVATSLRALRRSRKITQHEFAGMAGVTTSAISQAERGERGLSLSTLVRLTRDWLHLDDLLHGEDPATYQIGRRTVTLAADLIQRSRCSGACRRTSELISYILAPARRGNRCNTRWQRHRCGIEGPRPGSG